MPRAIAASIAVVTVLTLLAGANGAGAGEPHGAVATEQRGSFLGIGRARIEFKALYEGGAPTQVRHLRFGRLPVYCDGRRDGYVFGFLRRTDVADGVFVKRGHFRSPYRHSRIRLVGRVDADGNRASGILSWQFERSGEQCDTGRTMWKTRG